MYLRTVGLFRSDTLRFKDWYWPCGWMCKCLGWRCPATFILLLFEKPIFTLCLLAPRNTWCGNACFGAQVSSKYGAWYSERVILQFMCVGCWAGVTYLRYTQCWRAPRSAKQLSTVAILLYRFLSCWCLEMFFTYYQPCSLLFLFIHLFLANQISCISYVASVYRMRSLAGSGFSKNRVDEVT